MDSMMNPRAAKGRSRIWRLAVLFLVGCASIGIVAVCLAYSRDMRYLLLGHQAEVKARVNGFLGRHAASARTANAGGRADALESAVH